VPRELGGRSSCLLDDLIPLTISHPPVANQNSGSITFPPQSAHYLNMRVASRLLAVASTAGAPSGLRAAPVALLPPLPLYRRLLRAHRKHLPTEMRVLGDQYVKKEFKDHKEVENPMHIVCDCAIWRILTGVNVCLDRLLNRMANVCTANRGRFLEGGEA
jgi:hypothetical protein